MIEEGNEPYIPERDTPDEGVFDKKKEFIFFFKILSVVAALAASLVFYF